MSVISRQFTKDILLSTVFVLVILIALFAFFDLIGQMDEVGSNKYDLATAFLLAGPRPRNSRCFARRAFRPGALP